MSRSRVTAGIVFFAMLLAAVLAQVGRPTVYMTDRLGKPDLETLFPKQFDDWKLDDRAAMVMPSPETQALLNSIYNQTLARTYVNAAGDKIMLSVAYGGDQSDGTRAHLPEVCYPAQGFQIISSHTSVLNLATRDVGVKHLMTRRGTRNEPVIYWLIVGDQVAMSRTDQKLIQLRLGLKGLIPDGMLVRVSSIDADMSRGYKLQEAFLVGLAAAIPEGSRGRVFGSRFH